MIILLHFYTLIQLWKESILMSKVLMTLLTNIKNDKTPFFKLSLSLHQSLPNTKGTLSTFFSSLPTSVESSSALTYWYPKSWEELKKRKHCTMSSRDSSWSKPQTKLFSLSNTKTKIITDSNWAINSNKEWLAWTPSAAACALKTANNTNSSMKFLKKEKSNYKSTSMLNTSSKLCESTSRFWNGCILIRFWRKSMMTSLTWVTKELEPVVPRVQEEFK